MNRLFYTCLLVLAVVSVVAAPGNERQHIVTKGDTWYSVARKYQVPYKDLRNENKSLPEKLHPGDTLHLPGLPESAKAPSSRLAVTSSAQVRNHTVKPGETLTSIAKKYSCSVSDLKEWNKLSSGKLKTGQKLVISRKASAVAKEEASGSRDSAAAVPVKHAATPPADSLARVHVKQDSAPPIVSHAVEEKLAIQESTSFAKGRKEVTEEGAVAWIDDAENPGKYFALHRTAPTGTIIKVTNRMNHRVVFVKVVGKLPDTGDNESIILKISRAAADKLGVIDARFQAQLSYGVEAP